jgi:DNA replication protein DnaC
MRSADFAPLRFRGRTLDGYETRNASMVRALETARRFAAGELGSFVLAGPTGSGKTHLATAAAAARYEHDYAAWLALPVLNEPIPPWEKPRRETREPFAPRWCSVPELIVGLRSDMDRDREDRGWAEEAEEMRRHPGIVVLDDLGREKVSDWTGEILYTLVNGRYEAMRPTIVTTNLTGAELAASPYWPVISRLAEDGDLVRIDAEDHRLPKRAKVTP